MDECMILKEWFDVSKLGTVYDTKELIVQSVLILN